MTTKIFSVFMSTLFSVPLLAALLLTCNYAYATSSILLLGDSLSASYGMKQNQGWVHLLNQQLEAQNKPYRILNASISGETTAGGLSRLPAILSKDKVDHLIIELGGNDGLRGFPPTLIKNNLLQIIRLAQQQNIQVHLMSIRIPPNYGPRYNALFEKVFIETSQETNVTLLPFFLETIATDPALMQNDGIHPNVSAQNKIKNIMADQLASLIE